MSEVLLLQQQQIGQSATYKPKASQAHNHTMPTPTEAMQWCATLHGAADSHANCYVLATSFMVFC
jgi:hypothetical protein